MTLAGVFSALPLLGKELHENTFLFSGAGSAGIGIATMLAGAIAKKGKRNPLPPMMLRENKSAFADAFVSISGGLTIEEARKRIFAVDSRGLIVANRPKGGLAPHKLAFAHVHEPVDTLLDAVKAVKPTVIIGVSSQVCRRCCRITQ